MGKKNGKRPEQNQPGGSTARGSAASVAKGKQQVQISVDNEARVREILQVRYHQCCFAPSNSEAVLLKRWLLRLTVLPHLQPNQTKVLLRLLQLPLVNPEPYIRNGIIINYHLVIVSGARRATCCGRVKIRP